MKKITRILGISLGSFLLLGALMGGYVYTQSKPLPTGKEGPEADEFAQKMLDAVNVEAWNNTKVVKWSFGGRREHVWDKERHLAEVKWGKNRVLIDLSTKNGVAYKDGEKQDGEKADKLLMKAWEAWVNDSFWLNPIVKSFDKGVSRKLVELEEGEKALLVTFSSGGVTPGDSYLWQVDAESFLPVSWKMWVKIIPLKGVKIEWGGWETLASGAKVSTLHDSKVLKLKLENVASADKIEDFFEGKDPFEEIL